MTMPSKTKPHHTISYGKDDMNLFNELNRESQLGLIPIATLVKDYVRKGIKASNPASNKVIKVRA